VFNLALYVIVDPILADRLMELGVESEQLGGYFFIYPFTYAITSVFVDHFVLSRMSKRLCIITGFVVYGMGFFLTGPSRILTLFFTPSPSFT
jgi:biotin transporter BioY